MFAGTPIARIDQACLTIHARCFASRKLQIVHAESPCIACCKAVGNLAAELQPPSFPLWSAAGIVHAYTDGVAQLRASILPRRCKAAISKDSGRQHHWVPKPPSTPSARLVLLPGLQDPIIRCLFGSSACGCWRSIEASGMKRCCVTPPFLK